MLLLPVGGACNIHTWTSKTHTRACTRTHTHNRVTHIAPEAFKKGARIDASVDVFAFGIIMVRTWRRELGGRAPACVN